MPYPIVNKKPKARSRTAKGRSLKRVVSLPAIRKMIRAESKKSWQIHNSLKGPADAKLKEWFNGYAAGMDWILQISKAG